MNTGGDILTFDQRKVTEQAKFTYSPLGAASKKNKKTIEGQGEKNESNWRACKTTKGTR